MSAIRLIVFFGLLLGSYGCTNNYRYASESRNHLQQANAGDTMDTHSLGQASFDAASQIPLVPTQQAEGHRFLSEVPAQAGDVLPLSPQSVSKLDLSPSEADVHIKNLLSIIEKRLQLMPEMAQIKRALGDAIYDPTQEEKVLQKAWKIGAKLEIPPQLIESFVTQQMLAAKIIQRDESPAYTSTSMSREELEERKAALRKEIGGLMEPMLEALKPLSDSLHLHSVADRVDTLVRSSSIQSSEVREVIKDSLRPSAPTLL